MIKKIVLMLVVVLIQNAAFSEESFSQKKYMEDLNQKIYCNWFAPNVKCAKSSVVSFDISADGSISNVHFIKRSMDTKYDEAALNAVLKATPFKPLPSGKNSITVKYFFSPLLMKGNLVDNQNIINVSNIVKSDEFATFTSDLQKNINDNWNTKSLIKQRNTILEVDFRKDGSLDNVAYVTKSLSPMYNTDILEAISKFTPANLVPPNSADNRIKVQLNFVYDRVNKVNNCNHFVEASVLGSDDYNDYVGSVNSIISKRLSAFSHIYLLPKKILVAVSIDKSGQVKSVKVLNSTSINSCFDNFIALALQLVDFPPIPDKLGMNSLTLNYSIHSAGLYTNIKSFHVADGINIPHKRLFMNDKSKTIEVKEEGKL